MSWFPTPRAHGTPCPQRLILIGALALSLAACGSGGGSGDAGPAGPPGPPGPGGPPGDSGFPVIGPYDPLPGLNLAITGLSGATGVGGQFLPGNVVTVTFTVKADDGTDLDLTQLDHGRIFVSGPTFNYQRVIAHQSDLRSRSVSLGGGVWSYTFAMAIPAAYLAPRNDTASFTDGEMTGQPLLDGTYTVGMYAYVDYDFEGESYRDAGADVRDFLVGTATTIEPREVVTNANCNACHTDLRTHGGGRKDVRLCVLCHTAGAEDINNPAIGGGTPGVTIEFKVMVHKIHNGGHLPSVLGVATNPDGTRNYAATAKPLWYAGDDAVEDFSEVGFPVMPSLNTPMPRDQGYTALATANKATEDQIRRGPVLCAKCHGDPDGAGPLPAPSGGGLHEVQPSRRSCGGCHDDVNFAQPYTSNGMTMPAQATDSACPLCHTQSGTNISVRDAHTHPLANPALNGGLRIAISALAEAGTNNGDGTIDPGEKVSVTFTARDDAGADVPASGIGSLSTVVSGPTTNRNLLVSTSIPTGLLAGAQPWTIRLPEPVALEFVGNSTPSGPETFTTSRTPHLNMTGATTTVLVRTATAGGSTTLTADSPALERFVDVAGIASFAKDDYVVLESGVVGKEEYIRVGLAEGNRIWFTAGTRFAHSVGATVLEVTLTTKTLGTDYTLNAATGQVTEATEFGTGSAVLVSYTSDFMMPAVYPPPINDSPDLDETVAEWKGKSIVSGTYSAGIWGYRNVVVNLWSETQTYRGTSAPEVRDFLVGSATTIVPYPFISSGDNCNTCHNDLELHGGSRRGFHTCILCHGTAGSEDRARYTAANAPPTTGATINYREMLHRIHMGEELANAATYTIVGFGSSAWPNNYGTSTFGEIVFPAMPGKVKQCVRCHGNDAWKAPTSRDHPTQQGAPARVWKATCNSCHDSTAATAHMDSMSAGGVESCAVCHGDGRDFDVAAVHVPR